MLRLTSSLLTLLACLALNACSKPKVIAYEKLAYDNNVFSDPDTHAPFTGLAKEAYPDGHPKAEYPFKNGLFHGTVKEWWPNGKRRAETEFQDGMRTGRNTEWTEAGQLFRERVYQRDHIESEKNYEVGKER